MWYKRQENPQPWGSTEGAQKDRQPEEAKWPAQVKNESEFRDGRFPRQLVGPTTAYRKQRNPHHQPPSLPGYTSPTRARSRPGTQVSTSCPPDRCTGHK